MNEKTIQNYLYYFLSNSYDVLIPNSFYYCGEADFLAVSNCGYVYEYEIKISRADFKKDFIAKREKHEILKTGYRRLNRCEERNLEKYRTNPEMFRQAWGEDYEEKFGSGKVKRKRPNNFSFVVPEGLVSKEEIPDHCGLAYFYKDKACWSGSGIKWVKKPPRLHKEKISKGDLDYLHKRFQVKYWTLRMNIRREKELEGE
jgi:hypothetical protein